MTRPAPATISAAISATGARLRACFTEIATTRMADLPVMNPALSVAVREAGTYGVAGQAHWLAMLITPWFMSLVLMPLEVADAGHDLTLVDTGLAPREARSPTRSPMGCHNVGGRVGERAGTARNVLYRTLRKEHQIGTTQCLTLPSGRYEALWHDEPAFGGFWSIGLFSPMEDFARQDVALATADAALDAMLTAPSAPASARSRRAVLHMEGVMA